MEKTFPDDAHSFEVFAVKDCEDSPTGKQAFIGYKLANGDFHFVGVPYTEPASEGDGASLEVAGMFYDGFRIDMVPHRLAQRGVAVLLIHPDDMPKKDAAGDAAGAGLK